MLKTTKWQPWFAKATLVTGASSGLGAEFARQLAKRKCPLLITARREELLKKLKDELLELGSPRVEWLQADLNKTGAATFLRQHAQNISFEVEGLVNNAGLGHYSYFEDHSPERLSSMLQVNIIALTELCHEFLPQIQKANQGLILNVSSIASFTPLPRIAIYSATKAFVTNFSAGLNQELKDSNILSHAFCPGPTVSEFMAVAANDPHTVAPGRMNTSKAINICLAAVDHKKNICIPGIKNKLTSHITRLLPLSLMAKLADKYNDRPVDRGSQKK